MEQDRPAVTSDVYATTMRHLRQATCTPDEQPRRDGETREERIIYWAAVRARHEATRAEQAAAEAAGKTVIIVRPAPIQRPIVYYVRFSDRIKIGTTYNLTQRLQGIPHDEVLGTEPGGTDIERQRHRQFAKHRVVGEWFQDHPALREHIATLT